MKVLVTGATGFVGSHLVNALLERGDNVVALVRDEARARRVFQARAPHVVVGNLASAAALRDACQHVDLIYHVGGVIAARNRAEFFAVNEEGTRRLVDAAQAVAPALSRFVYVSSQAAAGPSSPSQPRVESDEPSPVSNYGASKLAGERAVQSSTLPWTIVRPPSVYGPRDTEFLRVFRIARWGVVPVFGRAEQELSFVHVTDLAAALIAAAEPSTEGKVYFAANAEATTARDFVLLVHRAVMASLGRTGGRPTLIRVPMAVTRLALYMTGTASAVFKKPTLLSPDKASELLAPAWVCSPAALARDTGWTAAIALEGGLKDTAQWYRTQGWL